MTGPEPAESILAKFPKKRPLLPPKLNEIYASYYLRNRSGRLPASRASQFVEAWMHRVVAADLADGGRARATLEVGAGTLNQLPFEKPNAYPYDIVEPMEYLWERAPNRHRIRAAFHDISEIPSDHSYDRITSVACFEHVGDLPAVVARCGLLLNPGGVLRVAIPSEGGALWAIGWRLTTGLEFLLRYGMSYGHLMRHEHLNTAPEIDALLRHYFGNVRVRFFGFSHHTSLYRFLECSEPHLGRCQQTLESTPRGIAPTASTTVMPGSARG